jgi:hypothetical protein
MKEGMQFPFQGRLPGGETIEVCGLAGDESGLLFRIRVKSEEIVVPPDWIKAEGRRNRRLLKAYRSANE